MGKAFKVSYVRALDDTFFILALVMVAGALLALLLPGRIKSREQ